MSNKTLRILLLLSSTIGVIACGTIVKDALEEKRHHEEAKASAREVLATMYALKTCLVKAHEGGYEYRTSTDEVLTDIQFHRIVYFLEKD